MKIPIFFIPLLVLSSCKKEIQITEVVTTSPAYVGDTLTTIAVMSEESGKAEFGWNILSPDGSQIITPIEHWDNVARWIPPMPGFYKVSAVAERGKEVSVMSSVVFIPTSENTVHKDAIVGKWIGTCSTAGWTDYQVQFDFFANGHYIGQSFDNTQTATYYGEDGDYVENTYALFPSTGPVTNGVINIYSAGSSTTSANVIESLGFYNNYQQLKFYFEHVGISGPVEYELTRQ